MRFPFIAFVRHWTSPLPPRNRYRKPKKHPNPDISYFARASRALSLTPRFSGVENLRCGSNCFNSFGTICETVETVETVPLHEMATYTLLKQGVNEIRRFLAKRATKYPG